MAVNSETKRILAKSEILRHCCRSQCLGKKQKWRRCHFSGNSLLHGLTPTHCLMNIHHGGKLGAHGVNDPLMSIVRLQLMSAWLISSRIAMPIMLYVVVALHPFSGFPVEQLSFCRQNHHIVSPVALPAVMMSTFAAGERTVRTFACTCLVMPLLSFSVDDQAQASCKDLARPRSTGEVG
jgi:hypothetical protein